MPESIRVDLTGDQQQKYAEGRSFTVVVDPPKPKIEWNATLIYGTRHGGSASVWKSDDDLAPRDDPRGAALVFLRNNNLDSAKYDGCVVLVSPRSNKLGSYILDPGALYAFLVTDCGHDVTPLPIPLVRD